MADFLSCRGFSVFRDSSAMEYQERILGDPGTGQDVTVILVDVGPRDQKLARIHLHSKVLSAHSKYFNTALSNRWTNSSASTSDNPLEFTLEIQTAVDYYFDCFSSMYASPNKREFQGVKYGLELVKVASQIEFQVLLDHLLLYLSTIFWSDEDEIQIRAYMDSPDFPRAHAQELVARLGLDESEEHRREQLCKLIRRGIRTAFSQDKNYDCTRAFFTELLLSNAEPSDFYNQVALIVCEEVKQMFTLIEKAWTEKAPSADLHSVRGRLMTMHWILETLLSAQRAEELIQAIVHFSAIPTFLTSLSDNQSLREQFAPCLREQFATFVLRMYKDVVDGRLLLKSPERVALLANWHSLGATLKSKEFEQLSEKLFITLPMKQRLEFIDTRQPNFNAYISTSSLISNLLKSWSARELESKANQGVQ